MKARKSNVRTANNVDQTKKTDQKNRSTYVYRYHTIKLSGNSRQEVTEEIEIIAGEDGVTEENIRTLHKIDDSDVYFNLKAKRPEWTAKEKKEMRKIKDQFIADFTKENGYKPYQDDIDEKLKEKFYRPWVDSLEGMTENNADGDSSPDKYSVLTEAWMIRHSEPSRAEERLAELVESWPANWQEIYHRVLINGESIAAIARERGVTDGAVRKIKRKIEAAIADDEELKKIVLKGTNSH